MKIALIAYIFYNTYIAVFTVVVISLNHNWFALRFYLDLCVYNIGKYIGIYRYKYILL